MAEAAGPFSLELPLDGYKLILYTESKFPRRRFSLKTTREDSLSRRRPTTDDRPAYYFALSAEVVSLSRSLNDATIGIFRLLAVVVVVVVVQR